MLNENVIKGLTRQNMATLFVLKAESIEKLYNLLHFICARTKLESNYLCSKLFLVRISLRFSINLKLKS